MIKDIMKQIEESENNFERYSDKLHIESERIKALRKQLFIDQFQYEYFDCKAEYKNINHLSEIAHIPNTNKIYIYINNTLSEDKAEKELLYAINNMLPGVIEKLVQEEASNQKEINNYNEEEMKLINIAKDNVTLGKGKEIYTLYKTIVSSFNRPKTRGDEELYISWGIATIYELGLIMGKREERAKRNNTK